MRQPAQPAQPDQPAVVSGLDAAFERAMSLAGRGRTVLGIAGAPGAGKSTLTDALLDRLREQPPAGADASWVAHVPMDGFHLADVQLARLGLLDRKGAPETFDVDGYAATLARLHDEPGRTVYAPGFERTLEQPISAALAVTPAARIVVTEGNYLLLDTGGWERVRRLVDEIWFVESPPGRVERLVERHVRFGKSPEAARAWVERVDEANALLVEATRAAADVVVRPATLR
ncbi:nucleoside/nucleotide kinase family protein [Nocardioides panacihumi]|uniref:Nucleoside/nucleotide kinase family protein n=1 Tax=Nocardioides panacihumi TaxID=400774 RepID=A0ABN2Q854_9ACTN